MPLNVFILKAPWWTPRRAGIFTLWLLELGNLPNENVKQIEKSKNVCSYPTACSRSQIVWDIQTIHQKTFSKRTCSPFSSPDLVQCKTKVLSLVSWENNIAQHMYIVDLFLGILYMYFRSKLHNFSIENSSGQSFS